MCGKGQATTTQTTAPNPAAMSAYQDVLARAKEAASTPYQPYGGELVAGITPQAYAGIANINQYSEWANPLMQTAAGYAQEAAQPISGQDISRYLDPYTGQVVAATEAQFNQQNEMQRQALMGNAIAQNALGGDRAGVAQAALAGQQQMAQAPVIAGLYSKGYGQALQTALTEQQARMQGAYGLGQIGTAGQAAALQGAGAQVQAGTLEQQTAQNLDTLQRQEYYQALGYDFETAKFLAGITTGVGSLMGGTATTQGPTPSMFSQLLGLGVTGAGVAGGLGWKPFAKRGGRINRQMGGFMPGGMPPYGMPPYGMMGANAQLPSFAAPGIAPSGSLSPPTGHSVVPDVPIGRGPGPPTPLAPHQDNSANQMMQTALGMAGKMGGAGASAAPGAAGTALGGDMLAAGGEGLAGAGLGGEMALGAGEAAAGVGGTEALASLLPFLILKQGGRVNQPYTRGGPVTQGGFGTGSIILPRRSWEEDKPLPSGPAPRAWSQDAQGGGRIAGFANGGPSYDPDRVMNDDPIWDPVRPKVLDLSDQPPIQDPDSGATQAWREGYRVQPMPASAPREPAGGDGALGAINQRVSLPPVSGPPRGLPDYLMNFDRAGVGGPSGLAPPPVPHQDTGISPGWQALIAAGLGMMSSRSPYPLQAIGEGGLTGLSAYEKAKSDELAAQRLQQQADYQQGLLGYRQQQADVANRRAALQEGREERMSHRPFQIGTRVDDEGNRIPVYGIQDRDGNIIPVDPTSGMPVQPKGGAAPTGGSPIALPPEGTPQPIKVSAEEPTIENPTAGRNEEYLQEHVPEQYRKLVKDIVDYKLLPSQIGFRDRTKVLKWATNYDGDYNAMAAPGVAASYKEFMSGGNSSPAGIMTRGRTLVDHLTGLAKIGERIGGYNDLSFFTKLANQGYVTAQDWKQNPDVARYYVALEKASQEATAFYRQTGGSMQEVESGIKQMHPGMSPEARAAAIHQQASYALDKVSELETRAKTGMGPRAWLLANKELSKATPEFPLLSEKNKQGMAYMEGLVARRGLPGPGGPPPAESTTPPSKGRGVSADFQPAYPSKENRPTPTDADRAYVRKHPEVRDKFIGRFGVEP